MSRRGRKAVLPAAGHARPERLQPDGLVVRHFNMAGRVKEYDFSTLPVVEPVQRFLAVLFAARCEPNRWSVHKSSKSVWEKVEGFAIFLAAQAEPPQRVEDFTAALIERFWLTMASTGSNRAGFRTVCSLLLDDERLQSGPVADALARRVPAHKSTRQSYSTAEFDEIKLVARRTFRSALLRIEDNARHLERFHAGQFTPGSTQWVVGEALELIARDGGLPRIEGPSGQPYIAKKYRKALGGQATEVTWQRLFLSRSEAAALGVLLLGEYGWNLSVIERAEVPRATPDPGGDDGKLTYRIPVEKHRRGGGDWYETENVTDHGAGTPGRLITEALAATRFARAAVERLAPGTDLLMVSRTGRVGKESADGDRHPSVGPFYFGLSHDDVKWWTQKVGLGGSPFQRGRRTVRALDRREPAQHSQETHDRVYVLPDKNVQEAAVAVIAGGAEEAVEVARKAVLVAELRDEPDPRDAETATADCADADASPWPAPGGGCGASFLLCLACRNAHVHPGHHPRLALLHQGLEGQRSVLAPPVWRRDWGDHHARLEDLKRRIGPGGWAHALDRVTDTDRTVIGHLLSGELNP
ncbi:hypothetical protein QMK19_04315 [Streptomyces sp. H10-C2]|uniref:hypothetical protein n=1 Tax=unclassified Streptomyces TaxID=2593676 RepID=UPI0024BA45E3|nr:MULTISPECIES: hypothetical protein [unclassified Streptomyces]MDJ0341767.1 hypothetical protein [Streptomyces sp. PH10-H1]MDJ0368925.1 hypothetical protein [Streptomyces sp. H10-C2]